MSTYKPIISQMTVEDGSRDVVRMEWIDEASVQLTFPSVVITNDEDWPAISSAIQRALTSMYESANAAKDKP